MHRANVAIFLTAVGLIGVAPAILVVVYLARKRLDARRADPAAASGRSGVIAVFVTMTVFLIGGGSLAWVLSARGLAAAPSQVQVGMPGMGSARDATRMSLPVLDRLAGLPLTS